LEAIGTKVMVAMGFADKSNLAQFFEANGARFVLDFLLGNGCVTAILEKVMATDGQDNG